MNELFMNESFVFPAKSEVKRSSFLPLAANYEKNL